VRPSAPAKFPRPRGFRPAHLVTIAEFVDAPAFTIGARPNRESARRGLAYERRAHRHFLGLFPPAASLPFYVCARWIRFLTSDPRQQRYRYAQPDGLLIDFDRRLITIIEMKLTHTAHAWWGLRNLYEPLIRKLFGAPWKVAVCEVCRYYDPSLDFPEPFTFVRSPAALAANEFGVMLLTPEAEHRERALHLVATPQFPIGLESL